MPRNSEENITEAMEAGDVEKVKTLLESGSNVNKIRDWGYTLLMMAAENGHAAMVRMLLDHGADAELTRHDRGTTAISLAIEKRHIDVVRTLCQALDIRCRNRALNYAASTCRKESVEILLDEGADINGDELVSRRTPLLHAVANKDYEMLDMLLAKGADINQPTRCTPLTLAVLLFHTEIVSYLIRAGADQKIADEQGKTAFDLACELECTEIAGILREATGTQG